MCGRLQLTLADSFLSPSDSTHEDFMVKHIARYQSAQLGAGVQPCVASQRVIQGLGNAQVIVLRRHSSVVKLFFQPIEVISSHLKLQQGLSAVNLQVMELYLVNGGSFERQGKAMLL